MGLTFEMELRATWQAVVEVADLLGEAIARLGGPPVVDGPGVLAVRGLVDASASGRRDDGWWEEHFPPPRQYTSWPTSGVPYDANAGLKTPEQREREAREAAERKAGWDSLTGGGRR